MQASSGREEYKRYIYFSKVKKENALLKTRKKEDGRVFRLLLLNIEFRYSSSLVVIDCDRIINLMTFFLPSYVAWPRADWTVDWFKNMDLHVFYCFVILFRCRMHASVPPKIRSIQQEDQRAPLRSRQRNARNRKDKSCTVYLCPLLFLFLFLLFLHSFVEYLKIKSVQWRRKLWWLNEWWLFQRSRRITIDNFPHLRSIEKFPLTNF